MLKIIWNENPLKSVIKLTDEGQEFLYKQVAEDLKFDEIETVSEINRFYGYALNSLSEEHCGDCTCIPASCSKCIAEYHLGVTTLDCSKKIGSNIARVFDLVDTIEEAIEYYETWPDPKIIKTEQSLFDIWTKTARDTADWLKTYRSEKLGR